jgi:hypothetical protein
MQDQKRDFKGIWIPKEIWLNPDLSPIEKLFLVEVDSLDNDPSKGCFASNEYFGNFFRLSEGTIANMVSSLKKRGFLFQVFFDGRDRGLRVHENMKAGFTKDGVSFHENMKAGFTKRGKQVSRKREHNNTVNNTPNNPIESLADKKNRQPQNEDLEAQKKGKAQPGCGDPSQPGRLRVTIVQGRQEDFDPPKKIKPDKPKKEPDRTIQNMVTAFETEHKKHFKDSGNEWVGFTWQAKEFGALSSIRKELERRYTAKMRATPTSEQTVSSWSLFLQKAATCDKFILTNHYTPTKLWAQFQSIIQKIHSNGNVQSSGSEKVDRDRRAMERLILDAAN